ncbi:hypothetical protein ACHAXS_011173, partial [Conticribra weissflogii]
FDSIKLGKTRISSIIIIVIEWYILFSAWLNIIWYFTDEIYKHMRNFLTPPISWKVLSRKFYLVILVIQTVAKRHLHLFGIHHPLLQLH